MATIVRHRRACLASIVLGAVVFLTPFARTQAGGQTTQVACVHDETELTAALAQAQANNADGKSDEIRLHIGHYDATTAAPDGWRINLGDGATGVAVLGGYTDVDCLQRSMDPALTILDGTSSDGQVSVRPLTIDTMSAGEPSDAEIIVSGLTFEDGRGDIAGALKISDAGPIFGGRILVERNIFRRNVATLEIDEDFFEFDGAPGALYAATDGPTGFLGGLGLIVRDNLFEANSGTNPAALFVFSNNEIAVSNNTFVGNTATQASLPERYVFHSVSFWKVELSSNVFSGNAPEDVFDLRTLTSFLPGPDEQPITHLYDNLLQSVAGTPAHEEGTLAGDPGFVDVASGDYRPGTGSLLLEAGRNDPPGSTGSHDARGEPRLSGAIVDIGAFERQPDALPVQVFLDGFE